MFSDFKGKWQKTLTSSDQNSDVLLCRLLPLVLMKVFLPIKERPRFQIDASVQNPLKDPVLWCQHREGDGTPPQVDVGQHSGWSHKYPAGVSRAEPSHPGPPVPGQDNRRRCDEASHFLQPFLNLLIKWMWKIQESIKLMLSHSLVRL